MDAASTTVNTPGGPFGPRLPQEPGALFGGLLGVCISDNHEKEARLLTESVMFVALGLASSLVTAYLLSAAGFLL